MSCFEMPRVIGQSRVPEPPARMIPRMLSSPLVQRCVEGVRVSPRSGSSPAPLPRRARARRVSFGGQQRLARLGREHQADVGVERVDAVLALGVVDVAHEVADRRVVGRARRRRGRVPRRGRSRGGRRCRAAPSPTGRRSASRRGCRRRSRAPPRASPSRTWPGRAGHRRSGCRERLPLATPRCSPGAGPADGRRPPASASKRYHSRNTPRSSRCCIGVIS